MDHHPANGTIEVPSYLVRTTFLHGDVQRGAFLARKNDANA
jgi:hypothetical protein